jgi:hypothetical protein
MAKKKKKKAKKADIMGAFTDAAEKELGPGALYTPSTKKTRHVGLPLPSFSFEFLLGSNVLWLGSSYGLAGPTQSFKSSLAMDLMRTVLRLGGYGSTVETEGGKVSEVMIASLLGELRKHHKLMPRRTVEEAQDALTFVVGWFEKTFPKNDTLFALMLDSLFGPPGEEKRRAILKEGHASRSYPIEALLWSAWLQTFSPGLTGYPIIFLFVNHLKKQMEGDSWRHPGGDAQDFYSTVYFHVSKVRVYDGADMAINQVQVRTVKNSFYLPGRRIYVPYVFDKVDNRLYFDWGHSTADLLASDLVPSTVKNVLDVKTSGKSMTALARTFSCKQLGLKDVKGSELGAAIHADAEIMTQLRQAARINLYDVWKGVMPVAEDPPKEAEAPPDLEEDADGEDGDDALDI